MGTNGCAARAARSIKIASSTARVRLAGAVGRRKPESPRTTARISESRWRQNGQMLKCDSNAPHASGASASSRYAEKLLCVSSQIITSEVRDQRSEVSEDRFTDL